MTVTETLTVASKAIEILTVTVTVKVTETVTENVRATVIDSWYLSRTKFGRDNNIILIGTPRVTEGLT